MKRLSIAVKLRSKDEFTHHNHNCRQFSTNLTRRWIGTENERMQSWRKKKRIWMWIEKKVAKLWFDSTVPIATLTIPFSCIFHLYLFSFDSLSSSTIWIYNVQAHRCIEAMTSSTDRTANHSIERSAVAIYFNFCSHTMFRILFYSFCYSTHCSTTWTRSFGQHLLVTWFFFRWHMKIVTFRAQEKNKM